MAVTIEALRNYGARRVTIQSSHGIFDGSIVSRELSAHSVMLLFAPYDEPQKPIVIGVDDISEVVER